MAEQVTGLPGLAPPAAPTATAKGSSALYAAVVMRRSMTSEARSLKTLGERTETG